MTKKRHGDIDRKPHFGADMEMSHDEAEYRRGYRDGWILATQWVAEAMFEGKMSRSRAMQVTDNFERCELLDWVRRGQKLGAKMERAPWPEFDRINFILDGK